MSLRYLLIFFLIIIVGGCTDFHTPIDDPAANLIPETYSTDTSPIDYTIPWWLGFNDPELTTLIETGLKNNFTIQQAWARLSQAQAVAKKSGAGFYPDLGGSAGAANNRSGRSNGEEISNDDFSLGLTAGYEVDLWGRVLSQRQEAEQTMLAKKADLGSAAMSVSGQIAVSWLELISARRKITQLKEQLDLNTRLLELVELRFQSAKATALDVYQQHQTVTAIEGRMIVLEATAKTLLYQLAVLIGKPPTIEFKLQQFDFPTVSPLPPGGLPSELLAQRPDIKAAEHQLESAAWSVAEAKADRLPKLRLSGDFTYNSGVLESLLDTWILRFAANFVGPIFDGGERTAEVERTEAVMQERLAVYRQKVLDGILEVEDALVRERQFRDGEANNRQLIKLTKMAYREATWRYLNGQSDYLPVLREQINLITTEQDQISLEKDLLLARVMLCKALGGTWVDELYSGKNMTLPNIEVDRK